VLYGAHVYVNIRNQVDADFSHRMSISYITNKLRAYDLQGGITVRDGGSSFRLCADSQAPMALYTFVYYYNGYLMEYVAQDDAAFNPYDGERIIAVDSFTVRLIPGGLMFHVGIDNEVVSFTVSLKCV